jgi:hypothetical protein
MNCQDAAAELEQVFDMAMVLELRLPETMERVKEMAEWHYLKEWWLWGWYRILIKIANF